MAEIFLRPKPLVIALLDGLGVAPPSPGNAVSLAHTPNLDEYWPRYPHCYLNASGLHVGLPNGIDGNSEVGHMNLGSGKVIFQELPRIDNSIDNGSFNANPLLVEALKKSSNNDVHIIGLLGSGSVHSAFPHLTALLDMAKELNADGKRIFLHMFTDGRDSPPQGAVKLFEKLDSDMKRTGMGRIASMIGRYYAMDRDERWERTKKAYDLITIGMGEGVDNWADGLQKSYDKKISDEYLESFYIKGEGGKALATVKPGDSIIFINFRADRAVQITRAFEDTEFPGWDRQIIPDIFFVGFSNYEKGFPKKQAFPPERISNPIGKVISNNGLRQLRISESEKYPHVTYFFNGGNQIQYPGEDHIEIPSPKDVATYDLKPEMSAYEVTEVLIKKIEENIYDVIVVNFANPDMVAHTGVIDATIKALEITDECVGKIFRAVQAKGGAMILSSDHGNAEEMIDLQTGNIDTKHSTNPVPLLIMKDGFDTRELPFGILADVVPTALALLGIEKPVEMTGRDLMV
jgi:2,3-bisphosphoglycerate-independent phosphoglycerate mutase